MRCWFNVWAPVMKVDHSCGAHSRLLSVSGRLPCIFKKPVQVGKTHLFILMMIHLMSLFSVMSQNEICQRQAETQAGSGKESKKKTKHTFRVINIILHSFFLRLLCNNEPFTGT